MNNTILKSIISLLILSATLSGCSSKKKENKEEKIFIVTTTGMLYDAVLNITKGINKFESTPLMGPGVDPHLYKATQRDLSMLRKANMVILNGLHLEGKISDILKKIGKDKPVIAAAESIPKDKLRMLEENMPDPHVWFSIEHWKYVIKEISSNIIAKYPDFSDSLQKNTSDYLTKLDELEVFTKKEISSIPEEQRILLTAHDAFGYFGDAYNIEVKGLQGISTVASIGLKDITKTVDLITNKKIKSIFVETSVSEKAIKSVLEGCKEKGHDVTIGGALYSDAMGDFNSEEGTYIGMFKKNVQTIVNALK